jgi:hypothetical protein
MIGCPYTVGQRLSSKKLGNAQGSTLPIAAAVWRWSETQSPHSLSLSALIFASGYVLLLGGLRILGWEVMAPGLASLIHQSIGVDKGDKQVEGGQAIGMKERAKSRLGC